MTWTRTILYAGTYERDYPRNQQLIRLLRRAGCSVIEVHEPFWEQFRDKSRGFGGPLSVTGLAIRLLLVYLKLTVRIISRLRTTDAVVIGYIGQLDMLTIGALARLFRVPIIFNPLVTLTDTIIEDRGLLASGSLMSRLLWFVDWLTLQIANVVITDTNENAEYLRIQFRLSPCKIRTLYVGADEQVFRPAWQVRDQSGRLHVLFYGKMIPLHGIETILCAIRMLSETGETDITFEIIGSGQQAHLVTSFLKAQPQLPVVYRPWVAYRRLPQRIASADCVLGIFGRGVKASRVVPNKVFQGLAVGAPVITRDSPATRQLLSSGASATLVPADNPTALVRAIRCMRDPDLRARIGREGHEDFRRRASDEALTVEVSRILREIPDPLRTHTAGRCP